MRLLRTLRWPFLGLSVIVALLAGCAAPAPSTPQDNLVDAVYYPPAPTPPRLQWLTRFSSTADFAAAQSEFSKFIAGEEAPKGLMTIYGTAIYDGKIFAMDSKAAVMATFDLKQQRMTSFAGLGGGKFKLPVNITVDTDGTKYITDTGRNQVLRFDRDNRYLGAFGDTNQFKPVDAAISGDRLYVADIQNHQIQVLNKHDGKLLFKFGKNGSGPGELLHPTNVAIGPNGDVFVAETSNFRVQRFTPDGKSVRTYGQAGDSAGSFARPKGLAIDKKGIMYVADAAFQNVQMFDTNTGKVLMDFGQQDKVEGLSLPAAIKIDYDNVALFKKYADPKFNVEYIVLVTSQVAPNKVDVFGYGRMSGVEYPKDELTP